MEEEQLWRVCFKEKKKIRRIVDEAHSLLRVARLKKRVTWPL